MDNTTTVEKLTDEQKSSIVMCAVDCFYTGDFDETLERLRLAPPSESGERWTEEDLALMKAHQGRIELMAENLTTVMANHYLSDL